MRVFVSFFLLLLIWCSPLQAQRDCASAGYLQDQLVADPGLGSSINRIESFIRQQLSTRSTIAARGPESVIVIPVVIHNLYHAANEKVTDEQVAAQIQALNINFRRLSPDTVNTPERFRARAADPGFEFRLAISDPGRRSTTGVIRKYTPVTKWKQDDAMKHSGDTGDDAWDTGRYLNIWVCNLGRIAGYSTFPGAEPAVDGVVLNFPAFGLHPGTIYDMGKTAVHEIGHWLSLRHIWGDEYCGDDGVSDTPPQSNFTINCPASGFIKSCDDDVAGAMYMNYMDLSIDACTNLFTTGQADRMRSLFEPGGARRGLLTSPGLMTPLFSESPLETSDPQWMYANLYPNPASTQLTIDFAFDIRWIGKTLEISNAQGVILSRVTINASQFRIDVSKLKPGYYFIYGKKEDGSRVQSKFIKI